MRGLWGVRGIVARAAWPGGALGVLLAAIAVALFPARALAFSEEFELALARGEYLFQRGEVAQAESYFDLCLEVDPQSTRANQYKGLCALETGRLKDAERYLLRAQQLDRASPEIAFDLARVYVTMGDGDRAFALIQGLPEDVRSRPLVRYFEGVALIQRKEYAAALVPLEDVTKLDTPQAVRASFYLGFAHENLGEPAKAREAYNRVMAQSSDAALVAEADRRVRRMEQRARTEKSWWSARAGAGVYYDSNIALEPEQFDVIDEEGLVARVFADADFRPLRHPAGYLEMGAGARYHALVAGDVDLRDFDLFRATARLGTRWRLFQARAAGYLGLANVYDFTMLDLTAYSHRLAAQPYFDLYETKWTATRFLYRFTYRRFPDWSERDGFEHEPGLQQFFLLPERDGYVQLAGAADIADADSNLYDYLGGGGQVSLDLKVVSILYFTGAVGYEVRDYTDHPQSRFDRELDLYGGLYVKPIRWLRVLADVQYTDNESRARYAYSRSVAGVSLEYRY